jgi:hypothetical protein
VAIGDFNNDAMPDLVVGGTYGNLVLLMANGDRTFRPVSLTLTNASQIAGVAVSDFNGDGQPDIVVVDSNSTNISILLNVGVSPLRTANFEQIANFFVGDFAEPVLVADFNGDGKLDLAIPNGEQSDPQHNITPAVAILLGKGHGLFEEAVRYPVQNRPAAVAGGDFNGDGKVDLAVGAEGGLSILLGKGDGRFETAEAIGGSATRLVTGDLNHDGKIDLLSIEGGSLVVRLGKGSGTFESAKSYSAGVDSVASGLVLGDFNHDGKLDVAICGGNEAGVWIFLGKGDGTFQTAVPYDLGGSAYTIITGDWNVDGKLDLATAASGQVKILLGNGDGTFQENASYATIGASSIAAGDFNDDGRIDLAVVGGSGLAMLLSNGDGTFQPTAGTDLHDVFGVATGDFNGDGKLDLVTVDDRFLFAGIVSIWVNTCSSAGPGLNVLRATNNVVISWPSLSLGAQFPSQYKLERATSPIAPIWEPVNLDPVSISGGLEITVPASQTQSFYRLRKP